MEVLTLPICRKTSTCTTLRSRPLTSPRSAVSTSSASKRSGRLRRLISGLSTFPGRPAKRIRWCLPRAGVPCVLIGIPVKNMHTAVEVLDMNALEEAARLVAHFAAACEASWEEELWN